MKDLLEEIAKLREQLAGWVAAADKAQMPAEFYKEYSEATMRAMQALLTKERERAEAAEAKLLNWTRRSESCESKLEQLEANEQLMILKAKLKAASEQEPFGEMKENGVEWFGRNPHAFTVGTKFYAAPIPHAELQSKNTALEIAVRNATQVIAELERKIADQLRTIQTLNECLYGEGSTTAENVTRIADLERDLHLCNKSNRVIAGELQSLRRKLAEQQARILALLEDLGRENNEFYKDSPERGTEELNTLLAQAREGGRKEAIPEIANLRGVDLRGDFAVQLVFSSCRAASAFADAMLAAAPKPEVKQ